MDYSRKCDFKFTFLFPNSKIGVILGKNQSVLHQLQTDHPRTEISFSIGTGVSRLCVSSKDKKMLDKDDVFDVITNKMLTLCSDITVVDGLEFLTVRVLIDTVQRHALNETILEGWGNVVGTPIVVSNLGADFFLTVHGEKDSARDLVGHIHFYLKTILYLV